MNNQNIRSLFSFAVSVLVWWLLTQSLPMAVGILLLIFIHEMGHFFAARSKGIPVTMPTFTPMGAFVQIDPNYAKNAKDEAYIAIAGPLVGGLFALGTMVLGLALSSELLGILGFWGVAINLLNLIPVAPLDGGRISLVLERRLYFLGIPLLIAMIGYFGFNIFNLFILFLILQGAWAEIQHRQAQAQSNPGYFAVSATTRLGYGALYLGMTLFYSWIIFMPDGLRSILVSLGL